MRNACKECDFYHPTNNTCQSKKCCTGGAGYVTFFDRLFCKPYKAEEERKKYKEAYEKGFRDGKAEANKIAREKLESLFAESDTEMERRADE